ncbi:MAG: HEAT repeat domain-containing protein [Proteobacteria bacterium]|nr:HEAT repeat domain-containing protein [Pseudomonadota bacterium]MBU1708516.1 HEAT repeat domain-containing protein [Pseudomonadota bacterium]
MISCGKPVKAAGVMAEWWCYDSPDPHFGNYWVRVSATSDENGHYEIKKPHRRAGWFGGSFTFRVNARGYVPVVVLMPDYPPLPLSTKAYPFVDTRAYAFLPETLDLRLNSFKPVLLAALTSDNAQYRATSARELGEIGSNAIYAVEPLIHRLSDMDATVRKYAAEALGKIGADAKDAAPALIETLNDEDEWVRLEAIDALGSIGSADDEVVNAMIDLLSDNNENIIKTHAVGSLTKLGPKAKKAVPILKDLLAQRWGSKYFRRDIEYALKKIDPDTLEEII